MAFFRVAFKTSADRIKAFKVLPKGVPIIGKPIRELVLSLDQLKIIKEAGIKVYPSSAGDGKTHFEKELDLDKIIEHYSN